MNVFSYVKNTISLSVPVAGAAVVLAYMLGCPEVSVGILIGAAGGVVKSLMLTNSVLNGSGPVKTFLARYAVLGGIFVAGAMISLHAFFAAAAAVLFIHVLFIMDQTRADKAGEIG
ncbi:MAG: hypothetical protein GXY28_10315 [Bacteriovoracaceae bacterium]|jgi:hypothetical protein|nr:hypothetical protein [Bacteriovoracaceae bacterium]HPX50468.1 hypothetical protein [Deltaproteobacteria bacterium]HRR22286.1 hypothetical protein [Desulfomonilia bacterium]HQA72511.1 hypothetical protein [Deltaproteobacteria bacterium]HRR70493.1 hypothetical protein [Desulfomonilia bacterium]